MNANFFYLTQSNTDLVYIVKHFMESSSSITKEFVCIYFSDVYKIKITTYWGCFFLLLLLKHLNEVKKKKKERKSTLNISGYTIQRLKSTYIECIWLILQSYGMQAEKDPMSGIQPNVDIPLCLTYLYL